MKTIFECETELGRGEYENESSRLYGGYESDYASVYAHTVTTLNHANGLMRIEQHCYLRSGSNFPDQPWIKPDIRLEPVLGSKSEMVEFSRLLHQEFVSRIKNRMPDRFHI